MGLLRDNKRFGATAIQVGKYDKENRTLFSQGVTYEVRTLYVQDQRMHQESDWDGYYPSTRIWFRSYRPVLTAWLDEEYMGWITTSTAFKAVDTVHFFIATELGKLGVVFDHIPNDDGEVLSAGKHAKIPEGARLSASFQSPTKG